MAVAGLHHPQAEFALTETVTHSSQPHKLVTVLEILILPLLFFIGLWLIMPAAETATPINAMLGVLIAGTLWLLYRSKGIWPAKEKRFSFSVKQAPIDALILISPLVTGFILAGGMQVRLDGDAVIFSLLTYPLYALVQLSIFLIIPATRLNKLGLSPSLICIICALLFAMVHLPNPLLMLFTGLAMLAFCKQFLQGRSILAIALIMGIAATGFKAAIPQEWAMDMRIGPDYVEKREALTND